eukprot:4297392-Prymnesium_polylepis.1
MRQRPDANLWPSDLSDLRSRPSEVEGKAHGRSPCPPRHLPPLPAPQWYRSPLNRLPPMRLECASPRSCGGSSTSRGRRLRLPRQCISSVAFPAGE